MDRVQLEMEGNQLQARAIGTYDQPHIHGNKMGIRARAVENNNFEIKSSLINMIENNKYHGLSLEDPLDHLDKFVKYCGLSKTNSIPEDAFKLRLFPFSLGDKAHTWEKNIPSFGEEYKRFRGYLNQYPHHGFTKESLLNTFYRDVLPKYRSRLDTGSNGIFLGRNKVDAEELVENMVHSDSVYSDEHDRSNIGSGGDDQNTRRELKALQYKMDLLLSERAKQEKLNFVGEQIQEETVVVHEVDGLEGQEELCFVNANGTCLPMTSISKRPMGSLPEKLEQHPKEYCNAILSTTSEMDLSDHRKEAEAQIVEKVGQRVEAKIVTRAEHKAEKLVIENVVKKLKEVKLEETHEVEQSPYDRLPFPQRLLTKAQKKVISKFRKDMGVVGVKLPQITNMHDAHVQMMLIKDILAHKEEVGELLDISTMQLDPPVTPKSLPKLETQGKFTLSCSLGKFTLDDALSLGIENMEPNTSLLMFGDSSSATPIGFIKNFPLKIGACTIPIDLTVLKMANRKRVQLILGTQFLTTVRACIDFDNKKVTLLNVNKVVSYPIKSLLINVEFCGTITCGELQHEKIKDEVMASEKKNS
ncbi:uncharacterized protein LOC106368047 [Brassica napus]|uniref:uncharacterized protein LOC106368047 n=1 Tax=Brassica napus TaxID=3708 RepID=UPI0006AAB256|nr:uncharacterized protein LOC106368047 [Brassica napus]